MIINGRVWGIPLIVLLFGTHLFLTFRLKFIQKYIFKAIKISVTKDDFGKRAIVPYKILWVIFVFVGSVFSLSLVWDLADLFNGLMAIPNLIALILLSPVIVSETKKYLWDDNLDGINNDPIKVIDDKGKLHIFQITITYL
ncbi:alanine:cation symporter family protein [Clostridium sp.]|uniref:alanine:cation symporter family protein n=1 Tax=Clostridium sp. TaxID=1506 RepID=UPI003FD8DE53